MPRRRRRSIADINMVPFIDIMLVLLIVFMVTAPLITPSLINLPTVGKAAQQPEQVIQIEIGLDQTLRLKYGRESQALTLQNLVQQVRQVQGQTGVAATPVVISADRNVKYETVVRVMDRLQRAGIARVGLSVQLGNE